MYKKFLVCLCAVAMLNTGCKTATQVNDNDAITSGSAVTASGSSVASKEATSTGVDYQAKYADYFSGDYIASNFIMKLSCGNMQDFMTIGTGAKVTSFSVNTKSIKFNLYDDGKYSYIETKSGKKSLKGKAKADKKVSETNSGVSSSSDYLDMFDKSKLLEVNYKDEVEEDGVIYDVLAVKSDTSQKGMYAVRTNKGTVAHITKGGSLTIDGVEYTEDNALPSSEDYVTVYVYINRDTQELHKMEYYDETYKNTLSVVFDYTTEVVVPKEAKSYKKISDDKLSDYVFGALLGVASDLASN